MMDAQTNPTKFIFLTGGVVSSLGKGIAGAAIGAIMEARGLTVSFIKLDPYVNVDAGMMKPLEHGEIYVTKDGAETDLDLGHYERFSSTRLTRQNSASTGKIYSAVIEKERSRKYQGKTVQVIPHITDEIKHCIMEAAKASPKHVDILLVEVGGTVGDIESLPFLEAIRQMRIDLGPTNVAFCHLTLVPYIRAAGELKTKPTQHSVRELLGIGIQPDLLICRSEEAIDPSVKSKIALFCNVPHQRVVSCPDAASIYEVPLLLRSEGTDTEILRLLDIETREPQLEIWQQLVHTIKNPTGEVDIAIVGKYTDNTEAYKSLDEALLHGATHHMHRANVHYIASETLERGEGTDKLKGFDAILVPGGFGVRGSEGKIAAIKYARENGVPFLGIGMGMQLTAVEFARNVAGLENAQSQEFDENAEVAIIETMPGQLRATEQQIPPRLGNAECHLHRGTKLQEIYGLDDIYERHRHRHALSKRWLPKLEEAGLVVSSTCIKEDIVEAIELSDRPFFIGCQFHPEFKSRPLKPHPLFKSFIEAAIDRRASQQS